MSVMRPGPMVMLLLLGAACPKAGGSSAPTRVETRDAGWHRVAGNPLWRAGNATPDGGRELSAGDPGVIYDDEEKRWKMWFSSGIEKQDCVYIKMAWSEDAVHWTVQDAPALEPATGNPHAFDHRNVETPSVVKTGPDFYLMYYSGLHDQEAPVYNIGLAISAGNGGTHFERLRAAQGPYPDAGQDGLILTAAQAFPGMPNAVKGQVADPEVVYPGPDGVFRLFFTGAPLDASGSVLGFGVSLATSSDGVHWTAHPANPLQSLRKPKDASGVHYASGEQPTVLWSKEAGVYEMWFKNDEPNEVPTVKEFTAYGFWHATSRDGVTWSADYAQGREFAWDPQSPSENLGLITGPEVVLHQGRYHLFYPAWTNVDVPRGFYASRWSGGFTPAVFTLNAAVRQ